MSKMREWEVWSEHLKGHSATESSPHIDVVYFKENMTEGEVRKFLIDHDGYPRDIEIYDMDGKEDETGPVQYKGYRIEVKHYPAFQHSHRWYLARCDYSIFDEDEKVCKGYDLNSVKDAIAEAKEVISKMP